MHAFARWTFFFSPWMSLFRVSVSQMRASVMSFGHGLRCTGAAALRRDHTAWAVPQSNWTNPTNAVAGHPLCRATCNLMSHSQPATHSLFALLRSSLTRSSHWNLLPK